MLDGIDVECRISKMRRIDNGTFKLRRGAFLFFSDCLVLIELKGKIYASAMRTAVFYGSGCWVVKE